MRSGATSCTCIVATPPSYRRHICPDQRFKPGGCLPKQSADPLTRRGPACPHPGYRRDDTRRETPVNHRFTARSRLLQAYAAAVFALGMAAIVAVSVRTFV